MKTETVVPTALGHTTVPPHVVRVYVARRDTNDAFYVHLILTRTSRHGPWLVVYQRFEPSHVYYSCMPH